MSENSVSQEDLSQQDETEPVRTLAAERVHRKRQVALGYRIFASLRWGDLGDGHITARDPYLTDHLWILRYPIGFENATVDDLVLITPDGIPVEDDAVINTTGFHIHHPIHAARPDVIGVAHTHTGYGTPFCASGRPLEWITQEACHFVDDWAIFDDEEVQVLGLEGGARIANALGSNRALLLRSHGLLTACESVGETIAAFVILERVCEALVKVPDAKPISERAARIARDDLFRHGSLRNAFDFLVSRHVGDPSIVG